MIRPDVRNSLIPEQAQMDSPCVKVCLINAQTRLCEGCARTIEEIAAWSTYTHEERHVVLNKIIERKKTTRKE
ncbi:MAG: DUF1289 domain-containing protein [Hyphomicrobium sp.]